MKKYLIIFTLLNFVLMQDIPVSIDYESKSKLLSIGENTIGVELESGETLWMNLEGLSYDYFNDLRLSADNQEAREFSIRYSKNQGVTAVDLKTQKEFNVYGTILPYHLIDLSLNACEQEFPNMMGYRICTGLARDAWESEIDRAILMLENYGNKELLIASQLSWDHYLKDYDKYLESYYLSDLEGHATSDLILYSIRNLEIIKNRALELQAVFDY